MKPAQAEHTLTKHQRTTLESLRDDVKESLYSRDAGIKGECADLRKAERNMRLRDQLDALEAVLRATAGEIPA